MQLSTDLQSWFQQASLAARAHKRVDFGLPELMMASLGAETLAELWQGLLKNEEHRQALLSHFTQSSTAVAAQEAARGDDAVAESEEDELEELREALSSLQPPPDDTVLSVLASWEQEQGEEELDADGMLQLLLYNWNQLYPVPLEKLGVQLERKGDGAATFLRAMFAADLDLNRRFGDDPMKGLLPYPEYRRAAMEVLVRRYRQNLLIYGQPGVGKSMVLRRLIEETAAGRVPCIFSGKRFFEFSRDVFLKDVQSQQDLSGRFDVLRRFLEQHPEIILVLDSFHHWFATESPVVQDFLQRLLGMFKYKKLHFVVVADVDFYNRIVRSNPVFDELLAPLYVKPLTRNDVLAILEEVKDKFEEQYAVSLSASQLGRLIEMADEHVRTMQFPKKALVLLDVALSILALAEDETPPDWEVVLRMALGRITGRDENAFPDLQERLSRLEELLSARIIGQDAAIQEVCRTIRFTKSDLDLNPERPDGVFLFAGPAGVGKQLFATELSRILYNRDPFLVDMSEFQDAESMALITGRGAQAEGGYPSPTVLERLRAEPRRVLILKNIEYASGEIMHFFLKSFEEGFLKDASGQQLAVCDTTVVLLSDLIGLDQKGGMGFQSPDAERLGTDQVADYFAGELLRGVDKLVVFQPLKEQDLLRILQERIMPAFQGKVARLGHSLTIGEDVPQWVARQGARQDLSARNVDRKFEELVAERVNEEILASTGGALQIHVAVAEGHLQLLSQPLPPGMPTA